MHGYRRLALAALGLCLAFAAAAAAQVAVDTSVSFRMINKRSALPFESEKTLWHFMPEGKDRYALVNTASANLLAASGSTVALGPDTGAPDRVWEIIDAGEGYSKIKNVASGLLLRWGGDAVVLGADETSDDRLWKLVAAGPAYPDPEQASGDIVIHDPSVIRTGAGTYFLFGTHDRIRMLSSPDLIHFTKAGQVFKEIPAWAAPYTKGDLWAPDVSFERGTYWLYYVASSFGKNTSAIGLATSETAKPESWTDRGMVISSSPGDNFSAIDPGLVIDGGSMPRDILDLPAPAAGARISYGPDPLHFGDLRLPSTAGPFPLLIFLHGGFWRPRYGLEYAGHFCDALRYAGVATWNVEYRRAGQPGGGWPGTLDDVLLGVRFVEQLAHTHPIDPKRIAIAGHSAGGQLALWAARESGIAFTRAISLAGVVDLRRAYELQIGEGAVSDFLGGGPTGAPERYDRASPIDLLPLPAPQLLLHGTADDRVPIELSERFAAVSAACEFQRIAGADHFDLVDPRSAYWPRILEAVLVDLAAVSA